MIGVRGGTVLVVCLVVLAACAGPAPRATPPEGTTAHTLTAGGLERTFLLHRPATLPAGVRVPLVVMIHGGGGDARSAEERYGWDAAADRDGFLVAYPEGVARSWNGGAGGCCGPAGRSGVDDVGFLSTMISTIAATAPVDPGRVFATGISEGGIMSYRLACSTHLLAAIAPDSATLLGPCPAPDPVSVLHIHGDADARIPYDGRPGAGPNHITGGPVSDVVARWRAVDRCPTPAVVADGPVHTTTADCPDGRTVTLIEIDGAGHQWPGAPPGRDAAVADPPSTALNATDVISAFFLARPRRPPV